jgi:hypothetical protein
MNRWLQHALQFAILTAVIGGLSALANWPSYRQTPPDTAVVKLSFAHGASRQADCRRRTPEELAKLPPNMRKPLECQRERKPLYVELDMDGQTIFRAALPPSGLSGDGPSRVYQRFVVPAGKHEIAARLRDTARTEGFDYQKTDAVMLAADQNLVIDFHPGAGGFVFR